MSKWFNPRVAIVVLSVFVLLAVTRSPSPEVETRRAIYSCTGLLIGYVLAFLLPLRRAVKFSSLMGMIVTLVAGWTATALALIADSVPVAPDVADHPAKWARAAFVAAAAIAFYLFFDHCTLCYQQREQKRAAAGEPPE
jgi:hypothetical protein